MGTGGGAGRRNHGCNFPAVAGGSTGSVLHSSAAEAGFRDLRGKTKKTLTNKRFYGIVYGRMEELRSFFYAQKPVFAGV